MPTFNKNKDSIAVDVNGSYIGADGDFETGDPYDDYVVYRLDETKTANAYYDLDDNNVDEDPALPGCGGEAGVNYTAVTETHTAKMTGETLSVISMDEWIERGRPLGDYWVYDVDGWVYWAIPVFPGRTTGLLLDEVTQIAYPAEGCYYAIDLVGQFASAGDWVNAEGGGAFTEDFYSDGITQDGLDLLERAARVGLDGNGALCLNIGNNVYQHITDHTGEVLRTLVCAGPDLVLGTGDDLSNVEMLTEPILVEGITYFGPVLTPTAIKPYYYAPGDDGDLGTEDDIRIWSLDPGGINGGTLVSRVVDGVMIEAADQATSASRGSDLALTATVIVRDVITTMGTYNAATQTINGIELGGVRWSVEGANSTGTRISSNGVLHLGDNESADTLTVVATSKADDRIYDTYLVSVLSRLEVIVTSAGNATTVQAGKDLGFYAEAREDGVAIPDAMINWSVTPAASTFALDGTGWLSLTRAVTVGTRITVRAEYYDEASDRVVIGTKAVTTTGPDPANVLVVAEDDAEEVDVGATLTFSAAVEDVSDQTVRWTINPAVSGASINRNTGVLSVGRTVAKGVSITVRATPVSAEAGGSYGAKTVRVVWPSSVEVTRSDTTDAAEINVAYYHKSSHFAATVKRADGSLHTVQDVVWELSAASGSTVASGTTLSQSGELTVSTNQAQGSYLVITAKSAVDQSVLGTNWVQVMQPTVPVAGGTVKYDNIEYYVLYKDTSRNRQLIVSKYSLEDRIFDSSSLRWPGSAMQTYLNGAFLTNHPQLKAALISEKTTIYTRTSATSSTFESSYDWVFLLSQADIYGMYSSSYLISADIRDYTLGTYLNSPAKFEIGPGPDTSSVKDSWKTTYQSASGKNTGWRLRNAWDSTLMANITTKGTAAYYAPNSVLGVRPAAWVKVS